jgi:excinuclease UvrABC ATPase subunit
MDEFIRIRGAREHNLRSIDLDLPRNSLVVITGLSEKARSRSTRSMPTGSGATSRACPPMPASSSS